MLTLVREEVLSHCLELRSEVVPPSEAHHQIPACWVLVQSSSPAPVVIRCSQLCHHQMWSKVQLGDCSLCGFQRWILPSTTKGLLGCICAVGEMPLPMAQQSLVYAAV